MCVLCCSVLCGFGLFGVLCCVVVFGVVLLFWFVCFGLLVCCVVFWVGFCIGVFFVFGYSLVGLCVCVL